MSPPYAVVVMHHFLHISSQIAGLIKHARLFPFPSLSFTSFFTTVFFSAMTECLYLHCSVYLRRVNIYTPWKHSLGCRAKVTQLSGWNTYTLAGGKQHVYGCYWSDLFDYINFTRVSIHQKKIPSYRYTVYPKKYAHGLVVLCFVVVMQSFIMNSHEVFIYIHQGCFAGTGAIARLPQCQWSKPDGYGIISQCITTTKHSKAKTVCIFLGIYCSDFQTAVMSS